MGVVTQVTNKYQKCIDACNKCAQACFECLNACFNEPDASVNIPVRRSRSSGDLETACPELETAPS